MSKIRLRVRDEPVVTLRVRDDPVISLRVREAVTVAVAGEEYTGPYTVKPDFSVQTLPTTDKTLRDDVTVEAIEVSRVSNQAGGTTVYIGGIF